MKIALVLPRFTGPYGGERHIINLANELTKQDHEVTLASQKIPAGCRKLIVPQVKLVEIDSLKIKNHLLATMQDFFVLPFLFFKMKKDFDIVHLMQWQSLVLSPLFKRASPKIVIVYGSNEQQPKTALKLLDEKKQPFKKAVLELLFGPFQTVLNHGVKKTDLIIANSERTAQDVKKIYGRTAQIVYPAVEVERFKKFSKRQARRLLNLPQQKKLFVSVSKLHKRKRLDLALKVFAEQQKKFPEAVFYIIGSGPEKENLKELVT
jgi:glycosyltransferase involved in cell wall biosynthesis